MEKRIEKLEKLFNALLKRLDNERFYNQADKGGLKAQIQNANSNISDIETMTEEALCDIDIAYSERAAELEEALCELSEFMDV